MFLITIFCSIFSCVEKFNKFAQKLLKTIPHSAQLPKGCSVFDVYVDIKTGVIQQWSEKTQDKARNATKSYTVLPQVYNETHPQ